MSYNNNNNNYDYEVLLSDDNDSVSSSFCCTDNDDDDVGGRKFVLGSNIFSCNPLEVISVKQIDNKEYLDKNSYFTQRSDYFDECLSVTEDEEDFCESEEIDNNEDIIYNQSLSEVKVDYELPTVKRFEPRSVAALYNSDKSVMDEISEYCIKERLRRLNNNKMEIKNSVKLDISSSVENDISTNSSSSKTWHSILKSQIDSKSETTVSSILLSTLSIDVLSEFINTDKPLKEIVSKSKKQYTHNNNNNNNNNNNSKKKEKKSKKQRYNNKQLNTQSNCIVEQKLKLEKNENVDEAYFSNAISDNKLKSLQHFELKNDEQSKSMSDLEIEVKEKSLLRDNLKEPLKLFENIAMKLDDKPNLSHKSDFNKSAMKSKQLSKLFAHSNSKGSENIDLHVENQSKSLQKFELKNDKQSKSTSDFEIEVKEKSLLHNNFKDLFVLSENKVIKLDDKSKLLPKSNINNGKSIPVSKSELQSNEQSQCLQLNEIDQSKSLNKLDSQSILRNKLDQTNIKQSNVKKELEFKNEDKSIVYSTNQYIANKSSLRKINEKSTFVYKNDFNNSTDKSKDQLKPFGHSSLKDKANQSMKNIEFQNENQSKLLQNFEKENENQRKSSSDLENEVKEPSQSPKSSSKEIKLTGNPQQEYINPQQSIPLSKSNEKAESFKNDPLNNINQSKTTNKLDDQSLLKNKSDEFKALNIKINKQTHVKQELDTKNEDKSIVYCKSKSSMEKITKNLTLSHKSDFNKSKDQSKPFKNSNLKDAENQSMSMKNIELNSENQFKNFETKDDKQSKSISDLKIEVEEQSLSLGDNLKESQYKEIKLDEKPKSGIINNEKSISLSKSELQLNEQSKKSQYLQLNGIDESKFPNKLNVQSMLRKESDELTTPNIKQSNIKQELDNNKNEDKSIMSYKNQSPTKKSILSPSKPPKYSNIKDNQNCKLNGTLVSEDVGYLFHNSFNKFSNYNFLSNDRISLVSENSTDSNVNDKTQTIMKNRLDCHSINKMEPRQSLSSSSSSERKENHINRYERTNGYHQHHFEGEQRNIVNKSNNGVEKGTVEHGFKLLKINYHCPDFYVQSKEEISTFLDYQWLMFCEMYTLTNLV